MSLIGCYSSSRHLRSSKQLLCIASGEWPWQGLPGLAGVTHSLSRWHRMPPKHTSWELLLLYFTFLFQPDTAPPTHIMECLAPSCVLCPVLAHLKGGVWRHPLPGVLLPHLIHCRTRHVCCILHHLGPQSTVSLGTCSALESVASSGTLRAAGVQ